MFGNYRQVNERIEYVYMLALRLEDPTGSVDAILYGSDAVCIALLIVSLTDLYM